jgi:hypothetical protein
MLVQDIKESSSYKLSRLNDLLCQLYGLRIDYSNSDEHLRQVFEHYRAMRRSLMQEHGIAGLQSNPQYAKAVLISESVNIYLREIAPKRSRKKEKGLKEPT